MFRYKSHIGGAAHAWSTYNGFLKQRKHYKEAESGSGEILKVVTGFPAKISTNPQNVSCPCENGEGGAVGREGEKNTYVLVTTQAAISKEPKMGNARGRSFLLKLK